MRYPAPFFPLIGRPAVFLLGLGGAIMFGFLLAAISQPEAPPYAYVNVAFLAAAGFPALAGWLAGMTVQEMQHATFAWPLPRVRGRLAAGFLIAGAVVAAFVGLLASQAASAQGPAAFFVLLGLASYCVGSVLVDPLQTWVSPVAFVLALGAFAGSRQLAVLGAAHPLVGSALLVVVALLAFTRLFARSTFRHKPFRPTSPFPGAYTLEHTIEYQRARQSRTPPAQRRWKRTYLGTGIWSWARAAAYETYGALTWRQAARGLNALAWLLAMFALITWSDMSDMNDVGFGDAFVKTIHEGVMTSPYVARFGDIAEGGGANPLVVFFISTLGAMVALRPRCSMVDGLSYPLSRRRRAAVVLRVGLIDTVAVFLVGAVAFSTLGLVAGRLAGYEMRFDYLPSFFLPLIGTAIAMPVAQWAGLHLGRAVRRRQGNGYALLIFWSIAFIVAVALWSWAAPPLLGSTSTWLGASALLAGASLALLRYKLNAFFATQDLV